SRRASDGWGTRARCRKEVWRSCLRLCQTRRPGPRRSPPELWRALPIRRRAGDPAAVHPRALAWLAMALPRSRFRRRPLFAELVADAMLVARAGVRQRVKNVVIMRTLRDGADFDLAWYTEAVRTELETLARENELAAEQLGRDARFAQGRHQRALTARDYVDRDVPKLRRRRRVHLALAARLRAFADDELAIQALIDD